MAKRRKGKKASRPHYRGKIELHAHAFAHKATPTLPRLRRVPAPRYRDGEYRRIWRIVEGGVRDMVAHHLDYLTDKGRREIVRSTTKRIVGLLIGQTAEAARRRSGDTRPAVIEDAGAVPTPASDP